MSNKGLLAILFCPVCAFATSTAAKPKNFDALNCDETDFAKALVGREMSNGKVSDTEMKYKHLRLKDLGADMLDEKVGDYTRYWKICDKTLLLLVDKVSVRDALIMPDMPSEKLPVSWECKLGGKTLSNVLPIYKTAEDKEPTKSGNVQKAWRVDMVKKKFVEQPASGLVCPTPSYR